MNQITAIKEIIEGLNESELIALHNEWCDNNKYFEDKIYSNNEYELEVVIGNKTPYEILQMAENWNVNDDYFIDGIYGLTSFSSKELMEHIDVDELAVNSTLEDYASIDELASAFAEQYAEEFGVGEYEDVEEWASEEDLFNDDWDELAVTYREEINK